MSITRSKFIPVRKTETGTKSNTAKKSRASVLMPCQEFFFNKTDTTCIPVMGAKDESKSSDRVGSSKYPDTLEGWQELFAKHPELNGKTSGELLKDTKSEASKYYREFLIWTKNKSGSIFELVELRGQLFSNPRFIYTGLKTIDDWKNEVSKRPDWANRSYTEMKNDTDPRAMAFYAAFSIWVSGQSNARDERRKIIRGIFPQKSRYSSLKTLIDWETEYQKHPQWNLPTEEMDEEVYSEFNFFKRSFFDWTEDNSKFPAEMTAVRRLLFPQARRSYLSLDSIKDWANALSENPVWSEFSIGDMVKVEGSEAYSFFHSYNKWVRRNFNHPVICDAFVHALFPSKWHRFDMLKTLGDWKSKLLEHPEWAIPSPSGITEKEASEASSFHNAFYKWVKSQTDDHEIRVSFLRELYPKKNGKNSASETQVRNGFEGQPLLDEPVRTDSAVA